MNDGAILWGNIGMQGNADASESYFFNFFRALLHSLSGASPPLSLCWEVRDPQVLFRIDILTTVQYGWSKSLI